MRRSLAAVPAAGAPGVFAAVRDGRSEWTGAAGIADLSNARPTRPEMRHRVGSITKTFVATVLLQLVDEGRLGLDDPVGRWLPDALPGELGQRVTVRMLLNHTSGIGNYTNVLLTSLATVIEVGNTVYTPAELVAIGAGMPRTGEPGEAHSYSNTNYILAGLIVQRVTGNDPAAEVTRRIIRPLRLTGTYFPGAQPIIRGPHAGAYFAPLGVRDFSRYGMTWAWMAGELISTMPDLNAFFRALLGGRLLSPATLAQMKTTVPFVPEQPEIGGYGLGIYQAASPCGTLWGHDGGVVGQLTVSLHSADGARQVSTALNYSHYQLFSGEPHPIDVAWQNFLFTGACAASASASRSTPAPLRLPAISALAPATR
ncbi:serine hydrolase [Solwaraspora sp. WMMD1047]|uniref:serine hydrolase domain-containing protein n=1 Tax=Solwaraspora sp. WMMD1047 TaxID=3016102 RepID=UPI002416C89F|nr:serine hydrolase domain-containing protein [Solwaraspora sp. WMMD1047]MDG4828736.1 serine hydrolase [Solwaraspora sp. WMMD1047]